MKGSEEVVELVEAALPEPALLRQPVVGDVEGGGYELVGPHPPGLRRRDQARSFQDRQVLAERRQGHGERFGQLRRRRRTRGQALDDGTAGGGGGGAGGP